MSKHSYELNAILRNDQGKGASRRLRREGLVPAIIYGGDEAPLAIAIKQDELLKNAKHDSFFSQIIHINIEGGKACDVLVRAVQHHIYKPLFQHFDFQRIVSGQAIAATVALNFINEETAPGVKLEGGIMTRYLTNVDIVCEPHLLPEYLEVDMGNAKIGDVIHLQDIRLPVGVSFGSHYSAEDLANLAVAQIVHPQRDDEETATEEAGE